MRLRVSGFGPFGPFDVNPSGLLAADLGREFEVLPVSYASADAFVESIQPGEKVLMLGVNGKASRLTLETLARNFCGPRPDVDGAVLGPGPIDPRAPLQIGSTLFRNDGLWGDPRWDLGVDAGDYLCNYVSFQALWRRPEALAGFVHVPPFEAVAREEAAALLREIADLLESFPDGPSCPSST